MADELRALLAAPSLSRADVDQCLAACTSPADRPLALAALARHLLPRAPAELQRHLRDALRASLSGTDAADLARGFGGLAALLQIDAALGAELLKDDAVSTHVAEAVELLDDANAKTLEARRALAALFSTAASFAACHATLTQLAAAAWCERVAACTREPADVRASAATAVVKLAKTPVDDALLDFLVAQAVGAGDAQSSALEGLAVATLKPRAKRRLAADADAVASLCKLASARRDVDAPDLDYSLAAILCHLVAYPPVLTDEQKARQKLQRLAVKDDAPVDDDAIEDIEARNALVLRHGGAAALVRLLKAPSDSVKATAARGLLALAEQASRRPTLLQAGAAKALLTRAGSTADAAALDRPAAQALAKLLITADPRLALGSPTACLDALPVLARLLRHPDATALEEFEALMALTNLASLSPELADRLAALPRALEGIEQLLFELEPPLRCRAAAELACNLAATSAARQRWCDQRSATLLLALARSAEVDEALATAAAAALARLGDVLAPVVLGDDKLALDCLELVDDAASDDLAMRGLVLLGELAVADPARARQRGLGKAAQRVAADAGRRDDVRATAKEVLAVLG